MYTSGQEFAQFSVFYLLFHENSIDLVRASIGLEAEGMLNIEMRGIWRRENLKRECVTISTSARGAGSIFSMTYVTSCHITAYSE